MYLPPNLSTRMIPKCLHPTASSFPVLFLPLIPHQASPLLMPLFFPSQSQPKSPEPWTVHETCQPWTVNTLFLVLGWGAYLKKENEWTLPLERSKRAIISVVPKYEQGVSGLSCGTEHLAHTLYPSNTTEWHCVLSLLNKSSICSRWI